MLRAAIATALLFATSTASAAIVTTIDSSGNLLLSAPPGAPGEVSRTYPDSAAETITRFIPSGSSGVASGGSIYAIDSVDPPMGDVQFYIFSNVVSAAGASRVEGLTVVRQAITNDSSIARRVTWASELLDGGLSVSWDAATPTANLSLEAAFDIDISLNGDNKYAASGRLDRNSASFSDTAQDFTNFRSVTPVGDGQGQFYLWERTPLTLELGVFEPGETRLLTYVARTLVDVDQFCSDSSLELCGTAFASLGDPPRSGGGVIVSAFTLSRFAVQLPEENELLQVALTFSPVEVSEPGVAWLALLGLGVVAARQRRRAI